MTEVYNNQKKVAENINSIFNNKGIFAAVAEKAYNNYKSKYSKGSDSQPNLHYFAVGHAFKNMDIKKIFDYQISDDEKNIEPTKYCNLQQNKFQFGKNEKNTDNLKFLIDSIRNINAHFIHDINYLKINVIDNRVIDFIKESFEVALIQGIYVKNINIIKDRKKRDFLNNEEKDKILTKILEDKDNELIKFMQSIFYQTLYLEKECEWKNKEKNKEKKNFLDSHLISKDDWIDWVLFNDIEENIEWYLNPSGDNSFNNHKHKVLNIPKGKYLSFEGCLFVLSMFLYANEANYLIPKLKGYKKTEGNNSVKLEVFRFFSKKFKSQDIDCDNNSLVKFRDIVQYLGKFPVKWNSLLHQDTPAVNELKDYIIESEIKKIYGNDVTTEFIVYAKYKIWNKKNIDTSIEEKYKKIDNNSKQKYDLIINQNPVYSNNRRSIDEIDKQLKKLYKKATLTLEEEGKLKKLSDSLEKLNEENQKLEEKNTHLSNPNTEKLIKRIESNLLFQSNGRNNDRFMEFATRYLAEVNYFGEHAKFKMYQYYFTEDERNALDRKRDLLTNKEFDKIHFHTGKQVYFETYTNHKYRYPEWDMPFVVQNNSIFIKIESINHEKESAFCIQRDLLTYLLEHALYSENPENLGKDLLVEYYNLKKKEYYEGVEYLYANTEIKKDKKTELKKLFPKRLLHHYYSIPQNDKNEQSSVFEKYLLQAETSEKQYKDKIEQAIRENTLDFFLTKNKGKQFKLRFIRKAWQLMYFREQYDLQKLGHAEYEKTNAVKKNKEHEYGHHKKFNITRDEYNDFSKWMFAFEEISEYKNQLRKLFEEKSFFENDDFKQLFISSCNLEQLYSKTKSKFAEWIKNNKSNSNKNRFKIENYKDLMEKGNVYINLFHFVDFAKKKEVVNKGNRPCVANAKNLYEHFYFSSIKNLSKEEKKLFEKLYKIRLEDCLLYEIAIQYLHADLTLRETSKNHLKELLVQDITIELLDIKDNVYTITMPFRDLEKFAQIQYFDEVLKSNDDFRLLRNIPSYLNNASDNRENIDSIKDMVESFKNDKNISLAHLCLLNNHLITQQGRFTNCIMGMEEYFIWKNRISIENSKNRIAINNISDFNDYFVKNDNSRNSAFHMNLPIKNTYKMFFIEIEKKFVNSEVKPNNLKSLRECPYMLRKTLEVFMNQMHDEIKVAKSNKNDTDEDKRKKRNDAENTFFASILQ